MWLQISYFNKPSIRNKNTFILNLQTQLIKKEINVLKLRELNDMYLRSGYKVKVVSSIFLIILFLRALGCMDKSYMVRRADVTIYFTPSHMIV